MTLNGPKPANPRNVREEDIRLKRLHKSCEVTLERYTAIANETCNLTAKLRSLPVDKDKRLEIIVQKKKEDQAHDEYQRVRQMLLAAIENDPELVNVQSEESATRVVNGTPRVGAYRRRHPRP